uniref:DUF433 domain-containing protein n=2 Tax=Kuenenia stuttgartiensis TaxID=174633 RepID=Q1Q3Q6_KUEST|nr:unknown protein [Candidatus Kuenenia stuttgartiensis]
MKYGLRRNDVCLIMRSYILASDVSEEEILKDYPHLTVEDIHACLCYAARSCKNEIYLELETNQ